MGLAASQARFLAITARKMNCEFQSMQIAQEKLSVTRDLQRASQDYQNSLNATKLVWDTQDDDVYDLSYGIMMTPSALNEYDPYLITNTQGKILLSDQMFEAAKNAKIIDQNGDPTGKTFVGGEDATSDGSRNAFLYQLGQKNQIEGSIADSIKKLGESGYTRSGIGGPVYDKTTANAMTTNMFINYMQSITYGKAADEQGIEIPKDADGNLLYKRDDKIYSLSLFSLNEEKKANFGTDTDLSYQTSQTSLDKKSSRGFTITNNGQVLSEAKLKDLTVGDLLNGKYEFNFSADEIEENDAKTIYKKILESIAESLGRGVGTEYRALNVDTESNLALDQAYDFTQLNAEIITRNKNGIENTRNTAQNQNNIIMSNNSTNCSFSLTNMVKSYLTNFAIAIEGYDCGFNVETESVKKSNYVTSDPTYYFLLKNDSAMTDKTMLNADFYNMLYNQIATNGAISDAKMRELYSTDKTNLQQALKNGTLFISSLHNDGYFYQGAYTLSGHVAEVTDEDAIARAEIEYNVQKAKLNHKEESLELQMKNLDMEISSLTTEIDSVKNLISKGVEKVFTMFST